jgi:tetratricopeptide (TPR) repeat protein
VTAQRVIWSIALIAVLAAIVAMVYRQQDARLHDAQVERMLALLREDPQARLDETRAAVNAVVEWAQKEQRQTPATYFAMGLTLHAQGRLDEAEQSLRNVLALRPDWALAQNGLGIILFAQDKTGEAEAAFRKAMELAPNWSRPHNDLAILLRLTGRLEEAEQEAIRAIELEPDSVDVHNNYGNLLVRMERYDEAEGRYLAALEVDPTHPWPHFNLACLYAQTGRAEAALNHLRQAVDAYPPFREEARTDTDLDPLREIPAFQELLHE